MTIRPATGASSRRWLRLAVVFVGAAAIWIGLSLLSDLTFGPEYGYVSHAVRACATFPLFLVLLFLVLRWEGKPAKAYGLLPDRQTPTNARIGALGYRFPSPSRPS
ncbi:hypothetical protein [Luethyella okanaganae]|uniref:Uncharacterized protein n=1 Tax=Luethyella okanaganae TaxID=69372 RepID=A0ABW1VI50_9MICO